MWASHGAGGSVDSQTAQRELLRSIHLSADGFTPADLSCPSAREVTLAPIQSGHAHRFSGTVVADDGSLKNDGSIPWCHSMTALLRTVWRYLVDCVTLGRGCRYALSFPLSSWHWRMRIILGLRTLPYGQTRRALLQSM